MAAILVLMKERLGADPTSPYFTGEDLLTHVRIARADSGQLMIERYEQFR